MAAGNLEMVQFVKENQLINILYGIEKCSKNLSKKQIISD